jgi:hypothetical protein
LQWKMLLYFLAICYIFGHIVYFWTFAMFCVHLVYFMVILYIFPVFGTLYQEQNLATLKVKWFHVLSAENCDLLPT